MQTHVYQARVMRVFDGDTVWVQPMDGGRWRKLRLDGIDAPEICQTGGLAARDALADRSLGAEVQVSERAKDDYGRGIARLTLGAEDINRQLVVSGLAWASRWHGQGPYVAEEAIARSRQLGVFSAPDAEPPRDFRRRHGPCQYPPKSLSVR
ncbi:MAG: thermonuclease family protein [Hydrogenophaga sp.]|uniref:thermonuclease family protein n=1 Tax=Hydrogenophaga sp. TaxID=1904254 RepID=UPI001D613B1B|nr:thermonuclease family protein [Hydrogenophaga sp.]MBX3609277.1 thermonuclease family protein [Hydrogenophaga sp.]